MPSAIGELSRRLRDVVAAFDICVVSRRFNIIECCRNVAFRRVLTTIGNNAPAAVTILDECDKNRHSLYRRVIAAVSKLAGGTASAMPFHELARH